MSSPQPEIPPPSLDDVLYAKRENYAVITLNRPVVLNAVNWSICRRLKVALDQAEQDDDVRAIILTGAGRAFPRAATSRPRRRRTTTRRRAGSTSACRSGGWRSRLSPR